MDEHDLELDGNRHAYAAAGAVAGYVLLNDEQRNRLANAGIGAVAGYLIADTV